MNCYRVKVETNNSSSSAPTFGVNGGHLDCYDGVIYVTCEEIGDVGRVIKTSAIKSIELLGYGYCYTND